jgi:predicted O-methyltransferase YrrM
MYSLDIPGWMNERDLKVIEELAADVPEQGAIVEVGSWLGQSTYAWAASTKAKVYAVDLWAWMPKEYVGPAQEKVNLKGDPFAQFLGNVGHLKNLMPLKRNSSGVAWTFQAPDIVFIDAMHQDPWVSDDVKFWERLVRPGGIVCGDDYSKAFPAVIGAAHACAARLASRVETPGQKFWMVRKPG